MIYWDTSCVIKLYAQESDSGVWEQRALHADDGLVASALMRTEAVYAFHQKEIRGEIKPGAAQALLDLLDGDIDAGRYLMIPLGGDVLDEACTIARECYLADPPVFTRTLDGIHLATARLLKCKHVATSDARMRVAAELLGFVLI